MASSRIASRYSKSLLDLANAAKSLDKVKADMDTVLSTCAESKDLVNLLNNPIVKPSDKKEVLKKVFKGCTTLSTDFIAFLVDKKREDHLPMVAQLFIQAYDKQNGISKATVVSAVALSKETLETVRRYVQGLTSTADVELTNEIDASIIGGMVIKHEDRLLDMSVAKELREIRKELILN